MKQYIILVLSAFILISCATQKSVQKEEIKKDNKQSASSAQSEAPPSKPEIKLTQNINANLRNIYAEADISFSFPQASNSASLILKIAEYDSAYIKVTGPFSIPIAKIFAAPNYFLFLNSLNGKAFEGSPSPEKLAQFIKSDLTYNNLTDLLRGRLLFDYSLYKFVDSQNNLDKFEYRNDKLTDVVIIDSKKSIKSYSRRDNGIDIMRINYEYSSGKDDKNLIKSMKIFLPSMQGTINVDFERYYDDFDKKEPFKFKVHKNTKITKVD